MIFIQLSPDGTVDNVWVRNDGKLDVVTIELALATNERYPDPDEVVASFQAAQPISDMPAYLKRLVNGSETFLDIGEGDKL